MDHFTNQPPYQQQRSQLQSGRSLDYRNGRNAADARLYSHPSGFTSHQDVPHHSTTYRGANPSPNGMTPSIGQHQHPAPIHARSLFHSSIPSQINVSPAPDARLASGISLHGVNQESPAAGRRPLPNPSPSAQLPSNMPRQVGSRQPATANFTSREGAVAPSLPNSQGRQPSHNFNTGTLAQGSEVSAQSGRRPLPTRPAANSEQNSVHPGPAGYAQVAGVTSSVLDRVRSLESGSVARSPSLPTRPGRALPHSPTPPPDLSQVPKRGHQRSQTLPVSQDVGPSAQTSQNDGVGSHDTGVASGVASARVPVESTGYSLTFTPPDASNSDDVRHDGGEPVKTTYGSKTTRVGRVTENGVQFQTPSLQKGKESAGVAERNQPPQVIISVDECNVQDAKAKESPHITCIPESRQLHSEPTASTRFTTVPKPSGDPSRRSTNFGTNHQHSTPRDGSHVAPKSPIPQTPARTSTQFPPKVTPLAGSSAANRSAPRSLTFQLATMALEEENKAKTVPNIVLEDSPPKAFRKLSNGSSDHKRPAIPQFTFSAPEVDDESQEDQCSSSSGRPVIPKITFGGEGSDSEDSSDRGDSPMPSITVSSAVPTIDVTSSEADDGSSAPEPQSTTSHGKLRRPDAHRPVVRAGGLICGGCGLSIVGRVVSAMGVRWHPHCFQCSICGELLEHVSAYEHDSRPYCHLDYHEQFGPQCYHCQTPIIDEQFITLDDPALGRRTYHEQHFFCAECGDPFMKPSGGEEDDDVGFTVYRGYAYCEACHVRLRLPKCCKCKRSIRDGMPAVEALGAKWHQECFACAGCEKPFDDPSFFQRGKMAYCEACFSVIVKHELD